mgnify:CR=1 FL=1
MSKNVRFIALNCVYIIVISLGVAYYVGNLVNKAAVVSFKNLYSVYSQALNYTVSQMGGETSCYYSLDRNVKSNFSGCEKFYKKFATNLRVQKYCKNNALSNGCIPVYKYYAKTPSCAGFSESMMNRYNPAFVMADSTNLTVFNLPKNSPKPMFAVDSNGKLFPNKTGYDLFSLVIIRNSYGNYSFHPNITYCLPREKRGIKFIQDVYK